MSGRLAQCHRWVTGILVSTCGIGSTGSSFASTRRLPVILHTSTALEPL